ncbi:heparinase II/III family protein, partial [bacterium]|nr:heparinase II/III family protein [bacterium]
HEGSSYWNSYMGRFTWWADVMRVAMGLDAFQKPYFSQVGYYPMYLMPPGAKDGGFGDLTANRKSSQFVNLVSIFAAQAKNPYWEWYVEQHGGASTDNSYIGFIRGALPKVEAKAPTDLPTSRCFWGTGQAMLNSNLLNANDDVQVVFKSSPFGTQSHGYESQNSFLLNAFGERLFIRTGKRDIYGSKHHQNWMWDSKSTNTVTVNGQGQKKHSASAVGEILEFSTSDKIDYVAGEASNAYDGKLDRFTRRILFIKPDAVLIYDTLEAPQPSTFDWRLHAVNEMMIENQHDILAKNGDVECSVDFLWPNELALSQTDKFDPPPRPRVKLTEYHLTAQTPTKSKRQEFITLFQPYKKGQKKKYEVSIQAEKNVYLVTLDNEDEPIQITLSPDPDLEVGKIGNGSLQSGSQVAVYIGEDAPVYFGK